MKNKKLSEIQQRIEKLESAYNSVAEQVKRLGKEPESETWHHATKSLESEIKFLRKSFQKRQAADSEKKPLLKRLLGQLEDAEKVVFRVFVLATTMIGAGALLSHEAAPLIDMIEPRLPTEQQEELDTHQKSRQMLFAGAQPLPNRLAAEREENLERLAPLLSEPVSSWFETDKISKPDSVQRFVDQLRKMDVFNVSSDGLRMAVRYVPEADESSKFVLLDPIQKKQNAK